MDHPAHGRSWHESGPSSSSSRSRSRSSTTTTTKKPLPTTAPGMVDSIFGANTSKSNTSSPSLASGMKPKRNAGKPQAGSSAPSGRPQPTPKSFLSFSSTKKKANTTSSWAEFTTKTTPQLKANGTSATPKAIPLPQRESERVKATRQATIMEVLVDDKSRAKSRLKQRLSGQGGNTSSRRTSSYLSDPPSGASTPPLSSKSTGGRDLSALTKGFVPIPPSPLDEDSEDDDDEKLTSARAKRAKKSAEAAISQRKRKAQQQRPAKLIIPGAPSQASEEGDAYSKAEARSKEQERREDDARRMEEGRRMAESLTIELAAWKSEARTDEPSRSQRLPKDAKSLTTCPFCNEPLPAKPSKLLYKLIQSLLDQARSGVKLASTSRLTACHRHRDERTTIPHGLAQGWPKKLDEAKLQKRAQNDEVLRILERRVRDPSTSTWFVEARDKEKARRGAATNIANFAEMQAGYYGEIGWMTLRSVITSHFLTNDPSPEHDLSLAGARIAPLTTHSFIDAVLLPELVCLLMQQDCQCSVAEARKLKENSSAYGIAMFPASVEELEDWGDDDDDDEEENTNKSVASQPAPSASRSQRAAKRKGSQASGQPSATPNEITSSASQARRPRPKAAANKSASAAPPTSSTTTAATELIDLAFSPPAKARSKPVPSSSSGSVARATSPPTSAPSVTASGSRPKPRARKSGPAPSKRSRMSAIFDVEDHDANKDDQDTEMPALSQDSLPDNPCAPLGKTSSSHYMEVDDFSQEDSLPVNPSLPLRGPSFSTARDNDDDDDDAVEVSRASQDSLPENAWQPMGAKTTQDTWQPMRASSMDLPDARNLSQASPPIPSMSLSLPSPPARSSAYQSRATAPFSDDEEQDDNDEDDATAPLPSQGSSTGALEVWPLPPAGQASSSSAHLKVASQPPATTMSTKHKYTKDTRMHSVESEVDELASTQESVTSTKRKRTFEVTDSPLASFTSIANPKQEGFAKAPRSDDDEEAEWDRSYREDLHQPY